MRRNSKLLSIVSVVFFTFWALSFLNENSKMKEAEKVYEIGDGYKPFVDFKFVRPQIVPTLEFSPANLFLVVLINSGATGEKYRQRRRDIRKTWGNKSSCESLKAMNNPKLKHLKWTLVFVVGKAGTTTNDDMLNAEEAKANNDMLIGDIEDNYVNNVIKLYMGFLWVSTLKARYILKTDDDVYVRIPRTIEYLVNATFPSRFYGGHAYANAFVIRNIASKWAISLKYFDEQYFPPFHFGAFYILSCDLLGSLIEYVTSRKPFHLDDAYVGVAMRDLKIKVTDISWFEKLGGYDMPESISGLTDCQVLVRDAFAHNVVGEVLLVLHRKVESLCTRQISWNGCCTFFHLFYNWRQCKSLFYFV